MQIWCSDGALVEREKPCRSNDVMAKAETSCVGYDRAPGLLVARTGPLGLGGRAASRRDRWHWGGWWLPLLPNLHDKAMQDGQQHRYGFWCLVRVPNCGQRRHHL